MTSTRFNVGLGDDGRNSSRVLRPPGGGHTDIFGGGEPQQQVRKDNGRNASSILEGTNAVTVTASPVKAAPAPQPQQTAKNESTASTTRMKVPPGGFSSGLW